MREQRLTARLQRYWERIRRSNNIPEIQRFNAEAIEDIWPHCFKISIAGKFYQYDYMGEPLIKLYGRDLTGQMADVRMKQFPASVVYAALRDVLDKREPVYGDGHLVNSDGRLIKYRSCFLPFGNAKRGVTHVVVGMSYRVF
jgi:hypothetical protein